MSKPLEVLAINTRDGEIHSHFGLSVGGQSIAYCYIRKNACSAFKRLFIEQSPVAYDPAAWPREIEFMARNHGLRSVAEIERHDRRVVVLRDPVERYVSAFVSLFVARTPPPTRHLHKLSEKLMERPVEDVSFDMLLEHHLPGRRARPRRLERHFWPQMWHLAPVTYTDVIDIDRLAPAMKAMLGDEMGARYFDRPVNATATVPAYEDSDAARVPARVLIERFAETGALPGKASFLGGGREAAIRNAYAEDAALYDSIHREGDISGSNATLTVGAAAKSPRGFAMRLDRTDDTVD